MVLAANRCRSAVDSRTNRRDGEREQCAENCRRAVFRASLLAALIRLNENSIVPSRLRQVDASILFLLPSEGTDMHPGRPLGHGAFHGYPRLPREHSYPSLPPLDNPIYVALCYTIVCSLVTPLGRVMMRLPRWRRCFVPSRTYGFQPLAGCTQAIDFNESSRNQNV